MSQGPSPSILAITFLLLFFSQEEMDQRMFSPVDAEILRKAKLPLSAFNGVMGLTGMTA